MTKKLYDEDAYLTEFRAIVTGVYPAEEDGKSSAEDSPEDISGGKRYRIVLDQTAFFPESGGQTPDSGILAGGKVCDVQIRDGEISHYVRFSKDGDVPAVGDEINGTIDWEHRFSNMQQHTGEHIFSGIVHKRFGYDNVGFHLSDHIVTMDYNGPLTAEEIREIERSSNEAIWRNIPVRTYYPGENELTGIDYRCKGELIPPIRIVEIEGVDVCARCAPHVRSTAEVGILKVIGSENYKGGIRLSILCGGRALGDYELKQDSLDSISRMLSAAREKLPGEIERIQSENGELMHRVKTMQQETLKARIDSVSPEARDVWLYIGDIDSNVVRNGVNLLTEVHSGYCGIFYGEGKVMRFIIGVKRSRESKRLLDARDPLKLLSSHFEAKGGGSAEMVQGFVNADAEAIKGVLV